MEEAMSLLMDAVRVSRTRVGTVALQQACAVPGQCGYISPVQIVGGPRCQCRALGAQF